MSIAGFSITSLVRKKQALLELVSCLWADAHRGKNGGMKVFD